MNYCGIVLDTLWYSFLSLRFHADDWFFQPLCFIYFELNPLAMDRIHPGKNYYNLRWIHLIEKLFG